MAKLPPGRPAERLQSKENFYQDTQSRLCYSVGLYLSDMLNYTVGLVPSPGWGYRSANGSCTGMMEEHRTGRVQIAVSAFIVLEQRMDIIDYTGPTYKYKYDRSLEPAPQPTQRLLKSYTQD
ncbi:Uncharacterized protein GBIM_12838 [Gryllus bimaculatus]|nr:Uncharacterized protein GBIM_12838 [Gryllus bimaculatus]